MKLLVVSKFNEDVEWVKKVQCKYIIFDKSKKPIPNSISRPNIGREAETLLYYIIEYYYKLPIITIFLQGDPRGNPPFFSYDRVIKRINSINKNDQFSPFLTYYYVDVKNYWDKKCSIWNDKLFKTCKNADHINFATGAELILRKKNILCRPIEFYKYLYSELMRFNGSLYDYVDGISPWTLEVLWSKIFSPSIKLNAQISEQMSKFKDV